MHGAVVANAVRDGDTLTDLGNLNLITDELIVTDLKDTDVSENSGINMSVSVSVGSDKKGSPEFSSNSSSLGLTNQGHRKEQTTAGTLGGGSITRRDGSEHELGDTNRDLDQRQVVMLDQQTGGLDATFELDHRVLSEDGRNSIKKDVIDSTQHVKEIAQAVDDFATKDINVADMLSKVDDYATNRKVIADKAANEAEQKKLRGDEGAEGSQEGLQDLSNALSDAHGLEHGANVALYDGSQIDDNTVAIDSSTVNKKDVEGAYHERDKGIYVNVDKTDMTDSAATVTTLVHEQTRHQMAENGDTGRLSRDDQTGLARAAGERAGDAWEAYSDLAGISTKGGGTAAQWRDSQRNSATVQQGTQNMAAINNNELKARQLNGNEASMMDKARASIDRSNLSDAEKAAQKSRLDDLACAEVQCAAGVNSDDPLHGKLVAMQERGEAIKQNDNTDILDMMADLGVETVAQEERTIKNSFLGTDRVVTSDEQQFEYDAGDKAQDFASKNTQEFAERVNNAAEAAVNGVLVVAAPVVDGLDNQDNGLGFTEHMAQQTRDNVDGALNYESEVGQRVLNSFSSDTFEEAPNYVLDTGLAGAGMLFPAAKGVKKIDDAAQNVFESLGKKSSQLDDSLIEAIKENADKSRSKKVEYDVDNETGFDTLANKRREAESNRELYQERMKDASPGTLDNRHVDNDLYENDRRTGDRPEEGAKNKESSRTITNFVRDVVKNVNEISELFE